MVSRRCSRGLPELDPAEPVPQRSCEHLACEVDIRWHERGDGGRQLAA